MPNLNVRELDPPTISRQFDITRGTIRHVSDSLFERQTYMCVKLFNLFTLDLLSHFVTLLWILKRSQRRCSVRKGVLKKLDNFTGEHLCWSIFLIKLQAWGAKGLKDLKRDSNKGVFLWNLLIFKSTYFEEHLRTAASEYLVFVKNNFSLTISGNCLLFNPRALKMVQNGLNKSTMNSTNRNSLPGVFCKRGVFKNFAIIQRKTTVPVSLLIKLQASGM